MRGVINVVASVDKTSSISVNVAGYSGINY